MHEGRDYFLPNGQHTVLRVYRAMILQITTSYPGLPDVRDLTLDEIRFFYEGERPHLHELSKLRAQLKAKS